jgi:hypothetical protein
VPPCAFIVIVVDGIWSPLPEVAKAVGFVDEQHVEVVAEVTNFFIREILKFADTHHVEVCAIDFQPEVRISLLVGPVFKEVFPLVCEICGDNEETAVATLPIVIEKFTTDERLSEANRVRDDTAIVLGEFLTCALISELLEIVEWTISNTNISVEFIIGEQFVEFEGFEIRTEFLVLRFVGCLFLLFPFFVLVTVFDDTNEFFTE